MKRLCFLSPDISHARKLVSLLKSSSIPQQHIYLLAREDINLEELPDSGPESDDFLPAYERGLALGGVAGLIAGLFALVLPPAGLVIGGGTVLMITLYGSGIGAFLTGLAGAAFPSSRLQQFEDDIEAGKILILVDVPKSQVDYYQKLIRQEDPELEVHGIEPPPPLFPK